MEGGSTNARRFDRTRGHNGASRSDDVIRVSGASLLSVVMAGSKGEPVGAITFERHRAQSFDNAR
jgi:hypothetical protein